MRALEVISVAISFGLMGAVSVVPAGDALGCMTAGVLCAMAGGAIAAANRRTR